MALELTESRFGLDHGNPLPAYLIVAMTGSEILRVQGIFRFKLVCFANSFVADNQLRSVRNRAWHLLDCSH